MLVMSRQVMRLWIITTLAQMYKPLVVITIRCSQASTCFFMLPTLLHCGHL